MKVDFYIAGIQKSGTTNLAYLLSRSSNIITHPQMECLYYWDEQEYRDGEAFLKKNYFFDFDEKDFESHYVLLKHSNSFTNAECLKRAYDENNNICFLLVFRNPVQRFISSYLMEKTRSLYPYSLKYATEKALKDKNSFEHQVLLKFGEYDVWIEKILKLISEKNIEFFLFEELYNDKEYHLKKFAEKYQLNFNVNALKNVAVQNTYKELKSHFYQKIIVKLRQSKMKEILKKFVPIKYWVRMIKDIEHINLIEPDEKIEVDSEAEEILMNYYLPYIERFEKLTGLKTEWYNFKDILDEK